MLIMRENSSLLNSIRQQKESWPVEKNAIQITWNKKLNKDSFEKNKKKHLVCILLLRISCTYHDSVTRKLRIIFKLDTKYT